jgi:hypothetical protein
VSSIACTVDAQRRGRATIFGRPYAPAVERVRMGIVGGGNIATLNVPAERLETR